MASRIPSYAASTCTLPIWVAPSGRRFNGYFIWRPFPRGILTMPSITRSFVQTAVAEAGVEER